MKFISVAIIAMAQLVGIAFGDKDSAATTVYSSSTLSEIEIQGLVQIREEEKLAGDVYQALYEKWNLRPFSNIEKSERTHMEAIKVLLDKFSIEDPVKNSAPGVFKSVEIAELYKKLLEKGSQSLNDALMVSAEIEELDIADIEEYLKKTSNKDIQITYQNLIKGSMNHLRTFDAQLKMRNITYEPVHISKDYYSKILGSKNETGR